MMEHKNKPAVFLSTSYALFIGNLTGEEMMVGNQELFGFNLGAFEQKAVQGLKLKLQHLSVRLCSKFVITIGGLCSFQI